VVELLGAVVLKGGKVLKSPELDIDDDDDDEELLCA